MEDLSNWVLSQLSLNSACISAFKAEIHAEYVSRIFYRIRISYVVKYSVSCLLWNFLLHRIFIFYRIFWKRILHVFPPLWKHNALVIVLDWKVGRTCRTMGNWMATRCGIYVVSTLRNRSILPDTTPSSIQDAKSTSLQCKGGNSCWWRITSCCKNCQQIDKNCQQIDNLTCSWELQGTSLFHTMGIPRTTRWRLNNIVGSGPGKLG